MLVELKLREVPVYARCRGSWIGKGGVRDRVNGQEQVEGRGAAATGLHHGVDPE